MIIESHDRADIFALTRAFEAIDWINRDAEPAFVRGCIDTADELAWHLVLAPFPGERGAGGQ